MKKTGIYLFALTAAVSASAAPLVSIGDNVDVFFNASLSEAWTSNLYSDHDNEVDDFITTLKVGLTAEYGRDTTFTAKLGFTESFLWYASETKLNNDLFNMFATAKYDGARYKAGFTFTYAQLQENNNDIGGSSYTQVDNLVRYNVFSVKSTNYYDLTAKINVDLNVYWNGTYYQTYKNVYSDKDVITIPLDIMYAISDKVRLGIATQYRKSIFSGGATSYSNYWGDGRDDFFLGLTLNGELTSKLSAKIYFGGTYRVYDSSTTTLDNELTAALSLALYYRITDKVSTSLTVSRDFGNGASRQSMIDTSVTLGASYAFSELLRMSASFRYTNSDYQYDASGRVDDEFVPNISISYSPIKNLSLSLAYNYIFNDSNVLASEYDRHYISAAASFKY